MEEVWSGVWSIKLWVGSHGLVLATNPVMERDFPWTESWYTSIPTTIRFF